MFRVSVIVFSLICLPAASAQNGKQGKREPSRPPAIVWSNPQPESVKELPPGFSHQTFRSQLAGQEIGYCVYLPEEYAANPDKKYPVIYNLHGNGGNEWTGLQSAEVLHEGIQSGRWPAVIMVMPNGGHSTFYMDSADGKLPIESIFLKEFIPYIDATFRTIASREGRCIEGFSMGGRGSTRLAIKHPELFCSLFCQAGNVPNLIEGLEQGDTTQFPISYMGTDRKVYEENDVYFLIQKNRSRLKGKLRIQIACGTKDGGHLPTIRNFHQALLEAGLDHTYLEIEGLGHNRTQMINLYRLIWFDYHIESLRLNGSLPR
ncbi:MAG: hypothetical protein KDA78_08075 [Planctomycetaceae bacterium]|nr:hypothetical protein [Planctomycetaceae bacterium]